MVDGRVFTWILNSNGAPLLTMLDGSGSVEIYAHAAFGDQIFSALTRTTTDQNQYVYHSEAVKRDPQRVADVTSRTDLFFAPLITGFDVTDPDSILGIDDFPIDVFGFDLGAGGDLLNFGASGLRPYEGALVRSGKWSSTDVSLHLEYCYNLSRAPETESSYPSECLGYFRLSEFLPLDDYGLVERTIYKRDWEVLSASDLNYDGRIDRVHVMESVSLFMGDCGLEQLLKDVLGRSYTEALGVDFVCEDGQIKYGTIQRVQFYDFAPQYDFNDADSDGVLNHEDFAPYDFFEVSDRDNDGVGDQSDLYPDDPSESADSDNDGIGNNVDEDDDNDGVPDTLDAFPLDPEESVDTDGDGIGDQRDTDDDNDGVTDDQDDSPRGDGYLDDDEDGILNREDADRNGDGLPEELASFFAGESVRPQTLVLRSLAADGSGVHYSTGRGSRVFVLSPDGVYRDGKNFGESIVGKWVWDPALKLLRLDAESPSLTTSLLDQNHFENVDWDAYDNAGRPVVQIETYEQFEITISAPGKLGELWVVDKAASRTSFAVGDNIGFVIDNDVPIFAGPNGDKTASSAGLIVDSMHIPFTNEELSGFDGEPWSGGPLASLGVDLVEPGRAGECATLDARFRKCGALLEFGSPSLGSIVSSGNRRFGWELLDNGVIKIRLLDGTGSVLISKHAELSDGSVIVLSRTTGVDGEFVYDSHGTWLNAESIQRVDSNNTFVDVPLINSFSLTDTDVLRDASGAPLEVFGFDLKADQSTTNFFVEDAADG